jgi:D-glycerate 3-kinase
VPVSDVARPLTDWERAFLEEERLPATYAQAARRWFAPLAARLRERRRELARPLLVGVNGSQGSGKSTCCAWLVRRLEAQEGLSALALSIDDFYLTRAERRELAASVHPLLAIRGVPGTHDMALLEQTVRDLLGHGGAGPVAVPRFDKAEDDRRPVVDWDLARAPVDVVLLEGWCLGARPGGDDPAPLNTLESERDGDGRWRRYVDEALARDFVPRYGLVDFWFMLRAPSFDLPPASVAGRGSIEG